MPRVSSYHRAQTSPVADRARCDCACLVAFVGVLVLGPVALAGMWTCEAIALAAIARRTRDHVAAVAACVHLVGAASLTLALVAPPVGLRDGVVDLSSA